ncbi:four helix bundle protein [Rhodohalobacter mucosus]|uniref:Four helix bundle protein n=1 Tax=Rhodohalobacter mucosus TaxID=2079485 RepID=A0A316TY78_9BACT|nr:four helix bundle protein [Rhodohalobacter mucosus]PWN07782.1 four helix bundle protein [Rhodohalobacter mucosus]
MKYKGPIYDKSFEFGLISIDLYKKLKSMKEYDLSRQILKSGTSIGANVNEAGAAVSRKDFVNKMSIALKEARESWFWLELLKASDAVKVDVDQHIEKCQELIKILTSIVKTTQRTIKK